MIVARRVKHTKTNCSLEAQASTMTSQPLTLSARPSLEPPDMSVLTERSQLDFYTTALKRWTKVSGVEETLLEDTVLTPAYKQAPELCREMTDNFNDSTRDTNGGIQRIVSWLKEKFGMNKHADMVEILNQFLNTTRTGTENFVDFITRFERNYAEVKKLGETFSPTCLESLLLRQAQLTDTDSQIITMT